MVLRDDGNSRLVNVATCHQLTENVDQSFTLYQAGVIGLSRGLALDEGKQGVRINA